uniref:Putative AAA-type ATPase Vps4 n=1 Tax=uncultured organism TaxID=155900 RepID=A0A0F6PYJ0_9ZZZZ|nr:putative AAA-type ATPase Vps4 [uncultured organism]
MSSNLYSRAKELAEKAIEADNAEKFQEALNLYLQAAEILVEMAKITRNPRLGETYELRAKEYISRAKVLKPMLKMKSKIKYSKSSGSQTEDEDDELEDSISGAIISQKPDITLDDVAGLHSAKRALREAIVLPLMRPDLFKGSRQPWRGILLHGPPGCGKTMIAKATAGDIEATFFNISAATLVSKYLGESEKLVKKLYEVAKEKQPSIIFIDEVDSLTQSRGDGEHDAMRRVKTQLLTSMEGVSSSKEDRVVTIGATNIPWEIDSAFRRRFQRRIFVSLPDVEAREAIFKVNSKGIELADDIDFKELSEASEGYSGSDIANICRDAIMAPIRDLDSSGVIHDSNIGARAVVQKDYTKALKNMSKSVSKRELVKFEHWNEEFGAS